MPGPGPDTVDTEEPRSASAIVGAKVTGSHLLHVEAYSSTKEEFPNGEAIKSRPFRVGGRSWRILYYPNGAGPTSADCISIFLAVDESVAAPFKARAIFSLLDHSRKPVLSHSLNTGLFEFSDAKKGIGFYNFIKRDWLEKSEHLKEDCFKISCDIHISKKPQTEDRAAASPFITVPPSDLGRHLGGLLTTLHGADVVFEVAGEIFLAHRNILAARSLVFNAELFGAMKESTTAGNCIQIDDMLPQVFKALLHFIYNDSLPEMEGQDEAVMAQHLLEAADRYDMQRLKLICEDRLCRHLDVSTAATTLVLAEQHNCQGLKDACIEFLESPPTMQAVMATDGFEHLAESCPALVKELIYPFIQVKRKKT